MKRFVIHVNVLEHMSTLRSNPVPSDLGPVSVKPAQSWIHSGLGSILDSKNWSYQHFRLGEGQAYHILTCPMHTPNGSYSYAVNFLLSLYLCTSY